VGADRPEPDGASRARVRPVAGGTSRDLDRTGVVPTRTR
jgi:hypothetical protein